MSKSTNKNYFAEILESDIATFKAQSWQWDTIPEFGSLVTATSNERTIFGIIYNITTGPTDPIRQPIAYQKTEEELRKEQPQIFEFLTTSFSCIAIGYQSYLNSSSTETKNEQIIYNLPPQPAKIHTFVGYATEEQYNQCFANEHFLHLVCNASEKINIEELLLAIIKHQIKHQVLTKKRFNKLIETFFMLNKNNYLQTKMFLSRVQDILQITPL